MHCGSPWYAKKAHHFDQSLIDPLYPGFQFLDEIQEQQLDLDGSYLLYFPL